MDKKYLHHIWTRIRPFHWAYFLAAFLLFGTVTAFALRANDLKMVELSKSVAAADKANGDVEGALQELRQHVHTHMNADTYKKTGIYPQVQLPYTYQRLQAAEQQRLQEANASLYTAAQQYCEQQNPQGFSGRGRIPCIEAYISSHGVAVQAVPDALYKFDFVSPRWSPDLAGWMLLLAGLSFVLCVLRLAAGLWLGRATK